MKRFTLLFALVIIIFASPAPAAVMPLDGSWTVLDEPGMSNGDFFANNYTWNSGSTVELDVTDLFVVTDVFEIYDFGVLVGSTPLLPDYAALSIAAFDSPPYTTDPDAAWLTSEFSKGSFFFASGAHSVTIRDIRIPTGFGDGTVAFRASAVPEPGTLLLLGSGLLGLVGYRRTRRMM